MRPGTEKSGEDRQPRSEFRGMMWDNDAHKTLIGASIAVVAVQFAISHASTTVMGISTVLACMVLWSYGMTLVIVGARNDLLELRERVGA